MNSASSATSLKFDLETVREVAALLRESELGEICIETTDEDKPASRLLLRRAPSTPAYVAPAPAPLEGTVESAPETPEVEEQSTPSTKITSPAVGIFRPATAAVKEGDVVKAKQMLGIVESLRVPNEIASPVEGRVLEMLVTDGQGVEYGQALFVIEEA